MSAWDTILSKVTGKYKKTLENQHVVQAVTKINHESWAVLSGGLKKVNNYSESGYRFHYSELKEATNNFNRDRIVGYGGFGEVYKGELMDGKQIALKRGYRRYQEGLSHFETEMEVLSQLRHHNLVSLIGYCEENDEMILVCDYMEQGTLRSHLYSLDGPRKPPLSWEQRLQICIDAAQGLHYLHTGCQKIIIHRDVKSSNILLDRRLRAKVSDFGLSKIVPEMDQSRISTDVKGTIGYLDPEYCQEGKVTYKSDVYSFGIVLLEVLCARRPFESKLPKEERSLRELGLRKQKSGKLQEIVDPILSGTIRQDSLEKFGEIVEKCLADNHVDRPQMGFILMELGNVLRLQKSGSRVSDANSIDDIIMEFRSPVENIGTLESTSGGRMEEAGPSNDPDLGFSGVSIRRVNSQLIQTAKAAGSNELDHLSDESMSQISPVSDGNTRDNIAEYQPQVQSVATLESISVTTAEDGGSNDGDIFLDQRPLTPVYIESESAYSQKKGKQKCLVILGIPF